MLFSSVIVAALASIAQAVDVHVVAVGKNPSAANVTGLKYFPEKIVAAQGSMVQFQFYTGNHTVTQSNFDNPCVPISSVNTSAVGIFSSFMPVAATAQEVPVFTVMVNDTKPIWIYCSQGPHCQKGMSMVINENPTANASRTLENYKRIAAGSTGTGGVPGTGTTGGEAGRVNGAMPAHSASLGLPATLLLVLGAGFALM